MKLQINKLSIWLETGQPRFLGMTVDEAQSQVRQCIDISEEWLAAIEEMQRLDSEKALTRMERKAVGDILRRAKRKGPQSKTAREKAIKLVKSWRAHARANAIDLGDL